MKTHISNEMKRLVHGTIPYLYLKLFHPESPKLPYYLFQKKHGYTRYPYDFAKKYIDMSIDVLKDEEKDLLYIIHKNNQRLYFPRAYTIKQIIKCYKALLIEQDKKHAHCYVDSMQELKGKTLLDIGSAEGIIALEAIEMADYVYLFECDNHWIEALNATFKPWSHKVKIVKKFVSKQNNEDCITLDQFLKDKSKSNIFLKIDVEGAENDVLAGAENLFSEAKDLNFAICTYHNKEDKSLISSYLERHKCKYFYREGLFYVKHSFRTAIVRGCSQ